MKQTLLICFTIVMFISSCGPVYRIKKDPFAKRKEIRTWYPTRRGTLAITNMVQDTILLYTKAKESYFQDYKKPVTIILGDDTFLSLSACRESTNPIGDTGLRTAYVGAKLDLETLKLIAKKGIRSVRFPIDSDFAQATFKPKQTKNSKLLAKYVLRAEKLGYSTGFEPKL